MKDHLENSNEKVIKRIHREGINKHKGACLWFTGLSGSGKTTLATSVENKLFEKGIHTYLLDGDRVRRGLNKNLGFSNDDRAENIRRIAELTNLFVDAGLIVLTAFISPFRNDREFVRRILPEERFIEIYVKCDIETCEKRDSKGLYKKARNGEIQEFTGISSPYEEPLKPEILAKNVIESDLKKNVEDIIYYLENNRYIR